MDNQSDSQPDRQAVNETDARWMTFAELAAARGIDKDSAVSLVRRHGWPRQRDNQGHVIALVPLTWISAETDSLPDPQSDKVVFETALAALREAKDGEIATFRARITTLREELTRAIEAIGTAHHVEVAALEAKAEAAEFRANRAEAAIASERMRADTLRQRIDIQAAAIDGFKAELEQAHQATQAVQDAFKALRAADAARRARGRLRRALAAWRGG